eukprot:2077353-Pleurochrysis_carterae.AAC.1
MPVGTWGKQSLIPNSRSTPPSLRNSPRKSDQMQLIATDNESGAGTPQIRATLAVRYREQP